MAAVSSLTWTEVRTRLLNYVYKYMDLREDASEYSFQSREDTFGRMYSCDIRTTDMPLSATVTLTVAVWFFDQRKATLHIDSSFNWTVNGHLGGSIYISLPIYEPHARNAKVVQLLPCLSSSEHPDTGALGARIATVVIHFAHINTVVASIRGWTHSVVVLWVDAGYVLTLTSKFFLNTDRVVTISATNPIDRKVSVDGGVPILLSGLGPVLRTLIPLRSPFGCQQFNALEQRVDLLLL